MRAFLQRRLPWVLAAAGVVVVAVVVAFAFASGGGSGSDSGSGGGRGGSADVTDPARWDLPALVGDGQVRLADFKGRPLVVNFFASWCGPCQQELPDLAAAAKQLAGRVSFVAVNSKEISASSGLALARSKGLPEAGVTLARDVGGQGGSGLHDAYDVRNAMPVNAFYDGAGKLVYVAPGQLTPDRLKTQLKDLFGVTL